MRPGRLSIALYVALIFVSGMLLGGFGYRLYSLSTVNAKGSRPSPEEYRRRLTEEMHTRLSLSPDQVGKLSAIYDETRTRFRENHKKIEPRIRELQKTIEPEMQVIRNQQIERINAILNADQRAEYEKMRKEREEKRQRERPGPRPPGF